MFHTSRVVDTPFINLFDSVCATTIVRTTTLARSSKGGDPTCKSLENNPHCLATMLTNYLGAPLPATIWSVVEANTGIICACLPMIKGLVFSIFPALSSRSRTGFDATALTNKNKGSQSRANTYGSNADHSYQPWTMQTMNHNSRVVAGKPDSLGRTSQEGMLGRGHEGHIMKTVELSITDHSDQVSLERHRED
jgi:hypothetical protein